MNINFYKRTTIKQLQFKKKNVCDIKCSDVCRKGGGGRHPFEESSFIGQTRCPSQPWLRSQSCDSCCVISLPPLVFSQCHVEVKDLKPEKCGTSALPPLLSNLCGSWILSAAYLGDGRRGTVTVAVRAARRKQRLVSRGQLPWISFQTTEYVTYFFCRPP